MTVIISPNVKKTSERINIDGAIIDPKTKAIIKPKEVEYVPSQDDIKPQNEPTTNVIVKDDPLSIQAQIEATKANLAKLEELKKLKIQEMEKQLELLKK